MEAHLRKGLAELGLGDDASPSLLRFGELLLEKNKVMNLTAITDPEDVASLHFLDSAALLTLADLKDKTVVDVGTGAGFPGMPLKILEPSILGQADHLLTGGLQRAGIAERAVCSRPGGGIRGRASAEL